MIKYKIDVLKALKDAGFTSYIITQNKLLGGSTLDKLRHNNANLSMDNINRLCELLNCDIGDIFEYVRDDSEDGNRSNTL
ncbi:MAG: helix-turn-helix domain-containing protein [Ruminococcus sp.]